MSSSETGAISIAGTYGLLYIGVTLACVLYGITLLQTFEFFDGNHKDGIWTKGAILALWTLDTLHLCLTIHIAWYYLVANFSNPAALAGDFIWSWPWQIFVSSLIVVLVEFCFAIRLQKFSKRLYVTVAIMLLGVLHLVFSIYYVAKSIPIGKLDGVAPLAWSTTTALAFSVTADIIICIGTCQYLWTNKTGFLRTDTIIKTLITYAVNTGLITTIVSLVCCILFATSFVFPATLAFFTLAKLYTNSLLAALNARKRINVRQADTMNSIHLPPLKSGISNTRSQSRPNPAPIQVSITNSATVGVTSTDSYERKESITYADNMESSFAHPYAADARKDQLLTGYTNSGFNAV